MKNGIIFCEWSSFPMMTKNLKFLDELIQKINFNTIRDVDDSLLGMIRNIDHLIDIEEVE